MRGSEDGPWREGTPTAGAAGGNHVLDALAAADAAIILPALESVPLQTGQILGRTGEAMPWVFFPKGAAVIALVALDHDGRTAEAVSIGADGLIGQELTELPGFGHLQVQMPGTAWRLEVGVLAARTAESPALRALLALQGRALLVRTLQAAVCAALHPVEARASRWLLTAQDRTGQPDLPVTQEVLAEMLGVRRTTVTRVIAQLSDKGLIRHRRSRVTVIDRMGLEQAACGCHAALLQRLHHVAPALYAAE
ncbi:Crp/Fnr family transcriptional regulator [Dankookia sp. GCM10030260]|uniref:Crp/Fnr family transcriptional regulator n=1 Tax=Dankookia sp. GCM10030260 TaxID=3273390 RepID=UPI00361179F8